MQALQIREFLASVTPALSLHFIKISLQIANLQGRVRIQSRHYRPTSRKHSSRQDRQGDDPEPGRGERVCLSI
jgi:hypothetical protein